MYHPENGGNMISDYFRFLKSKKPEPVATQPAEPPSAPAPSLDHYAPLVTSKPDSPGVQSHVINTQDITSEKTVVDTLDIATHGERTSTPEMLKRFLGRQPILNTSQHVLGYEFGLRYNLDVPATPTLQQMCDEMLIASLVDLDLQPMLGNKLAVIALSPAMLASDWLDMLPSHNMVLALECSQIPDPVATLALCQQRISEGFLIAIDNPDYSDAFAPLIALAKYVRIDMNKLSALELNKHVITSFKLGASNLIAKHVETEDEFEACVTMAFNGFQGYYFTQRQPNAPHRIDNNRIRVIELLNMVISHAEIPALESVLKRDAVLSYKLLTYINSPAIGLRHKLESITQALILLGYNQFYRWLTLLLFNSGQPDARGQVLLQNALIRARLIETLGAERFQAADRDSLFIVGIFSLLDSLLNVPMAQAVAKLNLSENLILALLHDEGIYAPFLRLAIACENGDQNHINELAAAAKLDVDTVNLAHIKTLIWVEHLNL